jgi:hypothetical protein
MAGVITIQPVQDKTNEHGRQHGYAILARGATGKKGGIYTAYRIEYDRYGALEPSRGDGLRKTATKKTGSAFKAYARLTPDG